MSLSFCPTHPCLWSFCLTHPCLHHSVSHTLVSILLSCTPLPLCFCLTHHCLCLSAAHPLVSISLSICLSVCWLDWGRSDSGKKKVVQQYTGREGDSKTQGREGDSQQVKERRETLRHREGKLSVRHRREGDGEIQGWERDGETGKEGKQWDTGKGETARHREGRETMRHREGRQWDTGKAGRWWGTGKGGRQSARHREGRERVSETQGREWHSQTQGRKTDSETLGREGDSETSATGKIGRQWDTGKGGDTASQGKEGRQQDIGKGWIHTFCRSLSLFSLSLAVLFWGVFFSHILSPPPIHALAVSLRLPLPFFSFYFFSCLLLSYKPLSPPPPPPHSPLPGCYFLSFLLNLPPSLSLCAHISLGLPVSRLPSFCLSPRSVTFSLFFFSGCLSSCTVCPCSVPSMYTFSFIMKHFSFQAGYRNSGGWGGWRCHHWET